MAMHLAPIFKKAYWSLAFGGLIYILSLLALTIPSIQRNALYAHRVNPSTWQNLSDVEQFGFLPRQVQPFTLTTPDNETLFAWHILPLHLYHEHERRLFSQHDFGVKNSSKVLDTAAFDILRKDPNAHVVVNFHGNAAHLGSAVRPQTYRQHLSLSMPLRPVHVFAIDYRGFGLSTGTPTEEGLIRDAETLLSFLTGYNTTPLSLSSSDRFASLEIPPSKIVLVGQSLGTAVTAAIAHRWTFSLQRPSFKALVLISGFTSLPKLLDSYSIKGIIPPLFSAIKSYPRFHRYLISKIVDKWETDKRIMALVNVKNSQPLDLTIMHARDDWEIPWREGRGIWNAAILGSEGAGEIVVLSGRAEDGDVEVREWRSEVSAAAAAATAATAEEGSRKRVRWERVIYGGHNRVMLSEQAALAILRTLDRG